MLGAGLGRVEMRAWSGWWQEELEGLCVPALEMDATLPQNAIGIVGA